MAAPSRHPVLALVAAALTGCAVGPSYRPPELHPPASYAAIPQVATPASTPVELAAWWQALGDAELDSLIERAVRANPDLEIALDRLQAARTFESGVLGGALPSIEGSIGGGRGTGSDLSRGRIAPTLASADNTGGVGQINAVGGFDAVWELDLFGRIRREVEAAHFDTQAAAAARDAVLVTVIADVARAYVELRGLQLRASILRATTGSLQESLRIVRIRYERGITNELDVTLAQRELDVLLAQLAPVEAQVSAAQYTLATLLGLYPEDLAAELTLAAAIPTVPPLGQPGVPLELLRRRPDVREVERELGAATARIGVAAGALFPQVVVTGAIGFQQHGVGSEPKIGQHIWSAGPGALWPLLDFGQLDAQVEIADFEARALLVRYKQTVQRAVQEVNTALTAYAAEEDSLGKLGGGLEASRRALTLANERYTRGLTDFLNVIDAEREQYDIEQQYAEAQVALADQFVALYRSLGGGWQSYQALPPIRRPLPGVIAAFREVLSGDHPLRESTPPAAAP